MTGFVKATPLVLTLVLLLSISASVSVPTAIAHADSGDRAAPVALYNAAELGNLSNLVNLDPGGSNQFTGSIPDASQDVATKDLSEFNLPFSSAVLTDPGRDDLDQPIRPPIAPAHMDWRWERGQGGFREVTTDFTIHNDVGDFSDQHGFYLILMQNSISDVGFYFGLQTDANGRGKALIFSRWKTRDLANAKYDDTYGWTESAGHEGDFIGVRRSYEWSAGEYRIRIAPDGLGPDGEWFGLWITDLNIGVTSWIGSLKFPLADGTAVIEPRSSATIELYGVEPIRPIDVPQWHVSVKRPLGDGIPSTWGYTSYPFDDSENALPNSDVLYDSPEDAAHLHVGGTTERVTPATARIDFEPMPASGTPPPGAHPDDFAALVALYNATDGANWTNNSNWLSDAPISQWHGVSTDSTGRVNVLFLNYNQLTGDIPAELGNLASLTSLNLAANQLSGEIPVELGNLANLRALHLEANQLTGEIPAELGGLSSLIGLYLGANQLTGEIPAELGGLSNLEGLHLFNNQLIGEIPAELGNLSNLEGLGLSGNQLSGEIPPWLGNLASLTSLDLSRNQLSGEIPAELGNLTNLEWLWLTETQLTGEIPAELDSLANLEILSFSGNQLNGEIPAELGSISSLRMLNLSGNQLNGEIPAELGDLHNLRRLYLGENQLAGEIPAELGNLSSLKTLELFENRLTGEIPRELGSLSDLVALSLSANQLSGEIPAELGSISSLKTLEISANQLSGEIPAELGSISSLAILRLHNNQLTGAMSAELGNLANLGYLDLSANRLSGETPAALGDLTNLMSLDLSGNQLTGEMPVELGNLTNLESLDLGGNQLSGEIPSAFGNLANLERLELFGNQLTGEIPAVLSDLAKLERLWLHENQLGGEIPAELGNLVNLTWLLLSENQFAGCIPAGLRDVAYSDLDYLGLEFCTRTGPGQPPTGTVAGDCATDGAVASPASRPGLVADCQALLAARDTLAGTGTLNWSASTPLANWDGIGAGYRSGASQGVTSLNLEGRELTGTIPAVLGNLANLESLVLAHNQLSGEIPAALGDLANLENLSLDNSQLSGEIPAALGNLTNLKRLYLSGNRLTGCIPAGLKYVPNNDLTDLGLDFCSGKTASTEPCLESLGTLTAPVTKTGVWAGDCASEARPGSFARYYSFTLTEAGQVEMNLTSGADPYLALRQGEGRDGTMVTSNDNVGSRNFNSSISRMLDAGAYTVEATTYFAGQTGSFTLSVRPLQETEDLGPLTRSVDRSNSAWTSDHESTQQMGSYARYYTFTLYAATHVVINLTSPEDPYLFLLDSRGAVVHENDNVTTRNLNSRIDETLQPGTYTIEATTYFPARTGTFHLSIGYFGATGG